MKVVGRDKITRFAKKHSQARSSLNAWVEEAESADWLIPQDIKDRYVSASILSENRVIFNIKGNDYRLVVKIRYQNGIVVILWVGTHAEYDKQTF